MSNKKAWFHMRWQVWLFSLAILALSAFIYHYTNQPLQIPITSGPIGQNATLKQRMIFVVSLEKSFHKRGWPASIDLEGEDGKTLKVYWDQLNLPFVKQLVQEREAIADMREMGFKTITLTNGSGTWNIDLKN